MENNFIDLVLEQVKQQNETKQRCLDQLSLYHSMNDSTKIHHGKNIVVEKAALEDALELVADTVVRLEDEKEFLLTENTLYKERYGELEKDKILQAKAASRDLRGNKYNRVFEQMKIQLELSKQVQ